MLKAVRWVIGIAVLVAGGFLTFRYVKGREKPGPRYETVTVDRGKISARVTATGTLSALVTVLVGSQVSGRLESVRVDFNSVVKKGEVIATIEPSLFKAAVEQARANYLAAQASETQAEAQAMDAGRQHKRAQALGAQQLATVADVEAAEAKDQVAVAQVSAAKAQVAQAAAALHQAEVNLKYSTITSPIDGVVISRSVDVGQTVAASFQAPTLFTIAQDLTKMQVHTNVAEGDVGKIQVGMQVTFSVDAYPGQRFNGSVNQVRDAAQTVQNVVTYDAVIDVDNSKRLLKPGMTATVTFTPAERDSVLRVPNAALRFRPEPAPGAPPVKAAPLRGNTRTVWRLRNGKAEPVDVQIGISDGSVTEIVGGNLRENDPVITETKSEPAGGSTRRAF